MSSDRLNEHLLEFSGRVREKEGNDLTSVSVLTDRDYSRSTSAKAGKHIEPRNIRVSVYTPCSIADLLDVVFCNLR